MAVSPSRRQLLKVLGGGVVAVASVIAGYEFFDDSGSSPDAASAPTEAGPTTSPVTEPPPKTVSRNEADVVVESTDSLVDKLRNADSGTDVWLASGTHELTESGIELRDQHLAAEDATIRLAFETDSSNPPRAIKVNDGVVIDGIALDADGAVANGLDIWGDSCVVRNCELKNFVEGRYPVNAYKANNVSIINNYFHDNATRGCALSGALENDEWVTNCLVAHNVFKHNRTGVKIRGARDCVVKANRIQLSPRKDDHIGRGILLQAKDHPNQRNLIVANNVEAPEKTDGEFYCLSLPKDRDGSDYQSKDNEFRANTFVGGDFTVYANNQAVLRNNTIINRTRIAALVDPDADLTVIGGTIAGVIRNRGGNIQLRSVTHEINASRPSTAGPSDE